MQTIMTSIVIERQVEEVFAFITDARNDPLWRSTAGLRATSPPSDGFVGIGSQLTGIWRFMGVKTQTIDEVTEYEPDRRYTRRLLTGARPVIQETLVFEPVAHGTLWASTAVVQAGGEYPVAESLLADRLKQAMATSMAKAKRLLERRVVDNAR